MTVTARDLTAGDRIVSATGEVWEVAMVQRWPGCKTVRLHLFQPPEPGAPDGRTWQVETSGDSRYEVQEPEAEIVW